MCPFPWAYFIKEGVRALLSVWYMLPVSLSLLSLSLSLSDPLPATSWPEGNLDYCRELKVRNAVQIWYLLYKALCLSLYFYIWEGFFLCIWIHLTEFWCWMIIMTDCMCVVLSAVITKDVFPKWHPIGKPYNLYWIRVFFQAWHSCSPFGWTIIIIYV